jgi:hypothetical protein
MNFNVVFNICFFYIDENSTFEIICIYVTLEIDLLLPVNFHVTVLCGFQSMLHNIKMFYYYSYRDLKSSIDMNITDLRQNYQCINGILV